MKAFLLVCLAAAVYAEPEADPLMVVPSLYNTHLVNPVHHYNQIPLVAQQAVQYVAQPTVQKVVSPVAFHGYNPVVYNAMPLAQEATVHETPELKGPGGSVAAKTAVAGQHTAYTLYHGMNKDKRSADSEADPALFYNNYNLGYGVPSVLGQAAYVPAVSTINRAAYTIPAVSTYGILPHHNTYVNGVRYVKREAESEAEADPAVLLRSAYTAGVPVSSYYNNAALYTPHTTSVVRPVVSSPVVSRPFYSTLGARLGWY